MIIYIYICVIIQNMMRGKNKTHMHLKAVQKSLIALVYVYSFIECSSMFSQCSGKFSSE